MILRQTGVMFVDAYRELNYKKMFWITLALSLMVVAAIGCIGINDQGFTVFKWTFPIELLNTSIIEKSAFYRFVFYTFGFGIWLTWAATILAIISTASIIPDFVSSGSIELSLSKPIGRLRLFFTKYLTGLTFVALQVAVFALGAFIVIGIRGGSWDLRMFWSIPLVLLFFSYLYCISALVGMLTRSTVAAILVTVLLWAVIWMAHMVESGWLLQTRVQYDVAVQLHESEITRIKAQIEQAKGFEEGEARTARLKELDADQKKFETALVDVAGSAATYRRVHAWGSAVTTLLPKTGETLGLLERMIFKGTELDALVDRAQPDGPKFTRQVGAVRVSPKTVAREHTKELKSRSEWWVVGTSLGFEAVVLGAAALLFWRRDF